MRKIESGMPSLEEDQADTVGSNARQPYDFGMASDPDVMVYRISGAFFFGAASTVGAVLDRIADQPRNFILDCSGVPFLDSTAANVLEGAARKAARAGVRFFITGASPQVRRMLFTHGVRPPHERSEPRLPPDRHRPGQKSTGRSIARRTP